jgi:Crp-like helix-turn-helix domain
MARTAATPGSTEIPADKYPLLDKLISSAVTGRDLVSLRPSWVAEADRSPPRHHRSRPPLSERPHPVQRLCLALQDPPGRQAPAAEFRITGRLIGFPASFFENTVNATASLTDVVVATVPFAAFYDLFARFPRVAIALYWMAAREAAIYGEHIVDIGRRSAYERLAHLILELLMRLRSVGLADELSYVLPLTQELIADVLGLSGPHVSRMLRSMREEGLVTIDGHRLTVTDLESLAVLAGFEGDYLARSRIPGLA